MAASQEHIARLLALNIPQRQIAAAVGVTEGRLSQMIGDEANLKLKSLIQEAKATNAAQEIEKDINLEAIERNLILKVGELVEDVPSLGEAVSALERLTKLRAIRAVGDLPSEAKRPTIFIGKLISTQIAISLTPENEIADVNGRSMATMATKSVLDLIASRSDGQKQLPSQLAQPAPIAQEDTKDEQLSQASFA